MTTRFLQDDGKRRLVALLASLALFALGLCVGHGWAQRNILPAKVPIVIGEAGLEFHARLDTGATVSSINAIDIEVIDAGDAPLRDHVGKTARFMLVNSDGERASVEARIAQVRGIRTSDCREVRYHVYLTVVRQGKSYRVLMNLNDRSDSPEKLLLGRNWLRHGYVVDASRT